MMGISWSGFNSLQVAARRPPQLKAVIAACCSDDRYDNDVHYYGGLPLGYYLMPWASVMLAFNARPPDPAIVGEPLARDVAGAPRGQPPPDRDVARPPASRRVLAPRARCARTTARSSAAVMAVGGWADAYVDAILRLLEQPELPAPGDRSGRGGTSGRSSACRGPRSASSRRPCAGGTTGSRARTTA